MTGAFGYLFSGAAQAAANGQNPLGDIVGKIWALPDTAIGIAVGSLDIAATFATTGELPQFSFGNNALQISNLHIGPAGGITFGNVELFTGYEADGSPVGPGTTMYVSPYTSYSGFPLGSHEEAHTYQAQALGPFFFPIYFLNGGVSASNPYETQADKHAATGASPLP